MWYQQNSTHTGKTHQASPIRTQILLEILYQIPVRHPLRYKLQRIKRYTNEGNDILVSQPFPQDRLPAECLRTDTCPSVNVEKRAYIMTDPHDVITIC